MTNYVMYNSSGRIVGNTDSLEWIEMLGDASIQYLEHEWVDPKSNIVVDSEVIPKTQDAISAEEDRVNKNKAWAAFRQKRDLMLKRSDFTQLGDSGRDKKAWAKYRQALRDLPENVTDPRTAIFPEPPE